MIPTDLAARISLQNGSTVSPLAAAKAISSELPTFEPGSRITAQIVAVRADGNFRALVDGTSITLAFASPRDDAAAAGQTSGKASPGLTGAGIKPGDTLQLTVLARNAGVLLTTPTASNTSVSTSISPSGQLISSLMGQGESGPAPLAAGQALLAQATPEQFTRLPGVLQKAVADSGLFYESHQAQWLAGKRDSSDLLREPQGRHSVSSTSAGIAEGSTTLTTKAGDLANLPPNLLPLVQQQLEAAANREVVWSGQVWPGQTMEWRVAERQEDGSPARAGSADDTPRQWQTSLKLHLPHLGTVEAALTLTSSGVGVRISADESSATLNAATADLAQAFATAGLPLLSLSVARPAAPPESAP